MVRRCLILWPENGPLPSTLSPLRSVELVTEHFPEGSACPVCSLFHLDCGMLSGLSCPWLMEGGVKKGEGRAASFRLCFFWALLWVGREWTLSCYVVGREIMLMLSWKALGHCLPIQGPQTPNSGHYSSFPWPLSTPISPSPPLLSNGWAESYEEVGAMILWPITV